MLKHDAAAYRADARACAEFANELSDPESRLLLLTLARAWLRLADHVDAQRGGNERPPESVERRVAEPGPRPDQDDPKA
jgi:hypothetical protein